METLAKATDEEIRHIAGAAAHSWLSGESYRRRESFRRRLAAWLRKERLKVRRRPTGLLARGRDQ